MKKIFLFVLLFIAVNLICNEPPVVSNIVVEQRDDGTYFVDIYYDLEDADNDSMFVSIAASDDEGDSWSYHIISLSGDTGYDIISGNNKHIIWDFAADHPEVLNIPAMIKITADDRNAGYEWCLVEAGTYTWGQYDEIQTIDYDYEIMKYKVTNAQYVVYLEEALEASEVWIEDDDVYGYYEGDENYDAGNYVFYDLGTPVDYNYGQISYNGNSFLINVPSGYSAGDFDDHPVVEVSWFGSDAFAEHYGWKLPTEQEWEKAARGMTGYEYPWGDNWSGDRANYKDSGDPWDNGTTPVGYYNGENGTTDSPSPYGCYDMCGNVVGWTDTWFSGTIPCRVLRAGLWNNSYSSDVLRSWYRNVDYRGSTLTDSLFGFRCVRTLP